MNRTNKLFFRAGTLFVSALCLVSLTGCFGVDSQFKHLRNTVVDGAGFDYEVEAEFGVGSMLLGLAKTVVGWADDSDSEIAVELLNQVKKVQIGSYRLEDFRMERSEVRERMLEIVEFMGIKGYDAIVRNYEDQGGSLILVRSHPENYEKVKELVVLSLDPNELAIVQLRGNVNEIVDVAVRDREVPGVEDVVDEAQ